MGPLRWSDPARLPYLTDVGVTADKFLAQR